MTAKPASLFPTTRWSLLGRAGDRALGSAQRKRELDEFLRIYLPVLRDYLVAVRRMRAEDAEALAQAFVAEQILQRNILMRADPGIGRFRSFLCVCLKNYSISAHRKQARRTAAANLDQIVEPATAATPDTDFDRLWARRVIAESLDRMQARCEAEGEQKLWQLFHGRVVAPLYEGAPARSYADLMADARTRVADVAANLLVKAKRWVPGGAAPGGRRVHGRRLRHRRGNSPAVVQSEPAARVEGNEHAFQAP